MATRLLSANIMVNDIKAAADRYAQILEAEPHWIYYPDNPDMTEVAFYPGDSKFALLHSTGDDEWGRFLREKGEGVGGIWFQVDDLDREIVRLRRLGVDLESDEPVAFPEGRYVIARPGSMYGITTGFVEARSDLPWGKSIIIPPGFTSPAWSEPRS